MPEASQLGDFRNTHQPSRVHNAPKRHKLLGALCTHEEQTARTSIPRITVRNSNLCTKCKRKDHLVLLSQIQPKKQMLGRDLRGRTKEKHKATPRSRSKGFPSLRGYMAWWDCRSRSPLSFPSKRRQESWRDGEEASSQKVNNGGERECQKLGNQWGKRPLK